MTLKIKRTKSPLKKIIAAGAVSSAVLAASLASPIASAQAPRLMAPPVAADGTLSFADLVERVSPSVVSVLVEREVENPRFPSQFDDFFRFRYGQPDRDRDDEFEDRRRMNAEGSGFFIDNEGHVVTNNHVVDGADSVRVRLAGGDEIDAEVIGVDPLTDLAVLKVKAPRNQQYVQFSDDVSLRVGDWVVAVGNPFGLGGTVTSGIVSAIGGQNRENQYLDFIQIDAPINRGNSGGPTFDLKGRVVGVNTAIYSPTGGSVGIGFAIPAKVAKDTVAQLIKSGTVTRGWLGIQLQEVTTEIAAALGLKNRTGVLVAEVLDETPAAKAGIENGDVILELDGNKVSGPNDLSRRVAQFAPGEKVKVRVLRDESEKVLNVTLGERDADEDEDETPSANDNEDDMAADIGLRVSELNEMSRQQYRVPDDVDGVLVTGVRPGSPADDAGLARGVVILQIDGEPVRSRRDLSDKIKDARKEDKDAVLLRMQFGENRQFGALSLNR